MSKRLLTILTVTFAVGCTITVLGTPPAACTDCLLTPYWPIAADDYMRAGEPIFPETAYLQNRLDFGVSFSGGGTRSASASLGQLRGLQRLGWLEHTKYVSAVSGGAWAAIPFTFSTRGLDELLGEFVPPDELTVDSIAGPASGALGVAITRSSLASGALREGPAEFLNIRDRQQALPNPLLTQIVSLTNRLRREGARDDKTYARLLGRIFVDDLIKPDASRQSFSWNGDATAAMQKLNPGKLGALVEAHPDRPFLIASGSIVSSRRDYVNPLLIPVEFTPLYVGVRQEFGRFGGGYVWPWAYDPEAVGQVTADPDQAGRSLVEVRVGAGRLLTLADVAASTGAAPEVPIINALGVQGPMRERIQAAATFFPHFNHVAVRGTQAALATGIAHADGGGIDNLGIMPLLVRHVRNIIVFNNTVTPLVEDNGEMRALFMAGAAPTTSTDSRGNQVFESRLWDDLKNGLIALREQKMPQVYCASGWNVLPNARFNIRGYSGLNICFVYNASASGWEEALAPPVRKLLTDTRPGSGIGKVDNFPYFKTFGQNFGRLIQLKPSQVNLLSSLTAWIVSNDATAMQIRKSLTALPCPRGMTCP